MIDWLTAAGNDRLAQRQQQPVPREGLQHSTDQLQEIPASDSEPEEAPLPPYSSPIPLMTAEQLPPGLFCNNRLQRDKGAGQEANHTTDQGGGVRSIAVFVAPKPYSTSSHEATWDMRLM